MGFKPTPNLEETIRGARSAYIAAADPVGDDPTLALALRSLQFVIVQDLFLTETAKLAHVVLPAAPFTEREGTFTNPERRVQRFYPAIPLKKGTLADFAITGQIAHHLGFNLESVCCKDGHAEGHYNEGCGCCNHELFHGVSPLLWDSQSYLLTL